MNQQNIQWTKIQVRQTIGALGIFLSVLILQIFAAVITLALSKVTGITPNSPNYVMFVSMLSAFMAAVWSGYWYWRSDWRKRDFSYRNALQLRQLIGAGNPLLLHQNIPEDVVFNHLADLYIN